MQLDQRADAIIRDHVVYSMTAAVVPIPLVDIGGVAAIQLRLIKDLADTYGVAYDGPSSTALVSSLVGASLARMGASAAKAIPGIGWFVGGATQALLSGASTYALGNVFRLQFETRRRVDGLDPAEMRRLYRRFYREGRGTARRLRSEPEERARMYDTALTFARLERLRDAGAISRDEFEILRKARLARLRAQGHLPPARDH